jgi:NADPH:quinone reductase-like Zn-dependent oxidoreductase
MRVVHIQKYGRSPILATCPLPVRAKGQYLIKMKYAPINPSDLNFYTGMYGIRKEGFPIMGFEGSGVIEQSDDPSLAGTRVSVLANMSNGTYAEYIVSNLNELIIWPRSVSMADEELSMFSINPLSVMGLCDVVAERASSQIVLSAAASNVNKMMVQYLIKTYSDKSIIGLSRSNSLDDQLKEMGYDHLFRMEEFERESSRRSNIQMLCFWTALEATLLGASSTSCRATQ